MPTRILAIIVAVIALSTTANAAVIASNIGGTPSGSGSNLGLGSDAGDRTKAIGITIGPDSLEFDFMRMVLSNSDGFANDLSGGIYGNAAGAPGTLLAAFDPISVGASSPASIFTIGTAAPFTLLAGTTYWFVLDGPSTTNSLLWQTGSLNTAPTTALGATLVGYAFSSNGGAAWGSSGLFNLVEINASEVSDVPEPSTFLLTGLVGGLFILRRKRQS